MEVSGFRSEAKGSPGGAAEASASGGETEAATEEFKLPRPLSISNQLLYTSEIIVFSFSSFLTVMSDYFFCVCEYLPIIVSAMMLIS